MLNDETLVVQRPISGRHDRRDQKPEILKVPDQVELPLKRR